MSSSVNFNGCRSACSATNRPKGNEVKGRMSSISRTKEIEGGKSPGPSRCCVCRTTSGIPSPGRHLGHLRKTLTIATYSGGDCSFQGPVKLSKLKASGPEEEGLR